MADNRSGQNARCGKLQLAEGKLGENRQRQRGDGREDGVRIGDNVALPETAVCFGWILHRLEVVGYRDDREEDQNEHGERYHLSPPVGASARAESQPENDHPRGQQDPGEIEDQFHYQPRFYTRDVCKQKRGSGSV